MKKSSQGSSQWSKAFRAFNDAKMMCEWYDGLIKQLASRALFLRETSNLGARFLNRTFSNFDKRRDPRAYDACNAYAHRTDLFPSADRAEVNRANSRKSEADWYRNSLIIHGGYGSGKTHLAAAIANTLIGMGIPVLFDDEEHGGACAR